MLKKEVGVPEIVLWLLRLAETPFTRELLLKNPLVFASWYAFAEMAIPWPQAVLDIQAAEQGKKLSLDRTLKLLNQVNYSMSGKPSLDHARRVLEGYAVHDWAIQHEEDFAQLARDQLSALAERFERLTRYGSRGTFHGQAIELSKTLGLNALEREILMLALMTSVSQELAGLFEQLAGSKWESRVLWPTVFGTTSDNLAEALHPKSALRRSGLLRVSHRAGGLASVSTFWVSLLASSEDLFETVVELVKEDAGAGIPARLEEGDLSLAVGLLKNSTEPGVNLLLYGAGSLEKRQMMRELIGKAGKVAWKVRGFDDVGHAEVPALTYLASRLLERGPDSVLVVERASSVLHTLPPEFMRAMFGLEFDSEDHLDFDEHLLSSNRVPTLWLTSDVSSLPDDTVAQFVFHAPLRKATREQRAALVKARLLSLKLGKKATEDLLNLEGVSSAQLASAIKASRLSGAKTRAEKDKAIVQAVKRSLGAMSRGLTPTARTPVTEYSLDYLNTSGRFKPEQVLESLRRTGKGTLVLYGLPGTGKTQFVEYLAAKLGRPLVAKRASELLSKWVGESEKNLSAAFEEAANEDAVLLLDEGDSFLRNRSEARAGWEVTQVNELLQLIERFEGIVVVCTNLFQGLDSAALRRFTFKIEFRELDADQRWEMFVNETGLKGKLSSLVRKEREAWYDRLCLMRQLTAGDFATVKRQCVLLGVSLSPVEWLEQLQIECDVKRPGYADASEVRAEMR